MKQLFWLFLDASFVPRAWKETTIIPVPKKPHAKAMNDFRPHLYPLQMYRESCCRGTHHHGWRKSGSVAVADTVKRHLDSQPSFVRILFMDFTSAINTVNINTLLHRLQQLQVNPTLMLSIKEFLMNRPQHVRVHGGTSTNTILNTGVPQGCVLSPILFPMILPARSMG